MMSGGSYVTIRRKRVRIMYTAKPTREQLIWQDMELGVIIHYCMEIYNPDFKGYKTAAVRTELSPEIIRPTKLDAEQWVAAAETMGAKYAVLVANHCTGFSLWPTRVNDYSVASLAWKNGQGDLCRDFIEACKRHGIRPGFYYSTGCNGYYDIDDAHHVYRTDKYRAFVKCVEAQVKELWTEYGDLFEIWFDGGIVPPEEGGPDLEPLLERYQPNAICFQGPRSYAHNVRWVGNENGLAPEECWATTNAGEARYDGTVVHEEAGRGDPDGRYYWPAETDMPNRSHKGFGGGWYWREGEEDTILTPEYLFDCYLRSVGRNSNLLLGMGISPDGDFKDTAQFKAFGGLIRRTFEKPAVILTAPAPASVYSLPLDPSRRLRYLVIREDITEGQRIRGWRVTLDGKELHAGACIGHKRILPLDLPTAGTLCFEVTSDTGSHALRDIALY